VFVGLGVGVGLVVGAGAGALLTLTVTLADVAFPDASVAVAVITCEPSPSVVVSIELVQEAAPVARAADPESILTCTFESEALSDAVPLTVTVPLTVEFDPGAEIATVGGVVSHGLRFEQLVPVPGFPACAAGSPRAI
jgi:hypothetical protein